MNPIEIQVRRLDPDVPLPVYAHPGDAGADLVTTVDVDLAPGERALVPTGLAIALPEGTPRSSIRVPDSRAGSASESSTHPNHRRRVPRRAQGGARQS